MAEEIPTVKLGQLSPSLCDLETSDIYYALTIAGVDDGIRQETDD